jgi:hypothetical protein
MEKGREGQIKAWGISFCPFFEILPQKRCCCWANDYFLVQALRAPHGEEAGMCADILHPGAIRPQANTWVSVVSHGAVNTANLWSRKGYFLSLSYELRVKILPFPPWRVFKLKKILMERPFPSSLILWRCSHPTRREWSSEVFLPPAEDGQARGSHCGISATPSLTFGVTIVKGSRGQGPSKKV